MKSYLFALSLATAGVSTAHAQVYQPAVDNSSLLGGIVGAVIGGHNHDRWGEGAIIGAAAGALIGVASQPSRPVVYQQPPVTVVQYAPAVPAAPMVGAQPVVVQQPVQVVYVPYYAPAPVAYYDYAVPVVRVGVGYNYYGGGPRRSFVRSGFRH